MNWSLGHNGTLAAEWPAFPLGSNAATLWIGLNFRGAIDDVTVYGRELSASEVLALATP